MTLNTAAIEYVLTFHLLYRHLLYCHWIIPKSTRPSLDLRSPSAALINEHDLNLEHRLPDAEPASKANAVYGVIQCINKTSKNYDANPHLRFVKEGAEDVNQKRSGTTSIKHSNHDTNNGTDSKNDSDTKSQNNGEKKNRSNKTMSDRAVLLKLTSMVSKAIHQVYLAWSLGGGQETKIKQEEIEENLRQKLNKMLVEKYEVLEIVTNKIRQSVDQYFEKRSDHQMGNTPLARYKHFMSLDEAEKMDTFKMTLQEIQNCSGSMIFDLKCARKKNVCELSPGFQQHGPDRYLNPKLLVKDASLLLIDNELSKRRTCRTGVNISRKPLTYARTELIRMQKFGAVNSKSSDGSTALMMAAATGNMIFIHYLLEAGANPYASDRRGNTALHYAAMFDHEHCAAYLISVGADPFSINKKGVDPYKTAWECLDNPGESRMCRMLSGAKAIWLRAGRGAREEKICVQPGTRCELTSGTAAESVISRSCGYCPWCRTTYTPTIDHQEHWPDKSSIMKDGTGATGQNLLPSIQQIQQRWSAAAVREGKLRKDADAMEFWLNRSLLPLNHIEIANIPTHCIVNHGIQDKTDSSGYPGTTVGGFNIYLSNSNEEEDKDKETTDLQKENAKTVKKKKKKNKKSEKLIITKIDAPSGLLPRGWRCISFNFRMKSNMLLRVRKNPNAKHKCIRITSTVQMDESYLQDDTMDTMLSSKASKPHRRNSNTQIDTSSNEKTELSESDLQKLSKSKSIKKRFQSKVKARMVLGMFKKAGTSRHDAFHEDEDAIFGRSRGTDDSHSHTKHSHHSKNANNTTPNAKQRRMSQAPGALYRSKNQFKNQSKKVTRRILRTVSIPVHSTSVVLTKSGDPAKYGNNILTLFLPIHGNKANIFSSPHAKYEILIDAGSLLIGERDPLLNCDAIVPEICTFVEVDGARSSWDRTTQASSNYMKAVLEELTFSTGIRTNSGLLSTVPTPTEDIQDSSLREKIQNGDVTREEALDKQAKQVARQRAHRPIHIFALREPPRISFGDENLAHQKRNTKYCRWNYLKQEWSNVSGGVGQRLLRGCASHYRNANITGMEHVPLLLPRANVLKNVRVERKDGCLALLSFIHVPTFLSGINTATGYDKYLNIQVEMRKDGANIGEKKHQNKKNGTADVVNDVNGINDDSKFQEIKAWRINLRHLHAMPTMPDDVIVPELFVTRDQRKEMETLLKHSLNGDQSNVNVTSGVRNNHDNNTGSNTNSNNNYTEEEANISTGGTITGKPFE